MAHAKTIPVSLKVGFSFLMIALCLLSIIFVLFIPNINHVQYQKAIAQTTQIVRLSNHQILLVVDYFREYRTFEKEKSKKEIETILDKIKMQSEMDDAYGDEALQRDLASINRRFNCSVSSSHEENAPIFLPHDMVKRAFDFEPIALNQWESIDDSRSLCTSLTYFLYKTKIHTHEIRLTCHSEFENGYKDIEKDVKKIVQDGFALSENIHKGKVYLMWISQTIDASEQHKRMDMLQNDNNQAYCISKISNVNVPQTGELSVKEILDINDTTYVKHTLDDQPTLTWISKIYSNDKEVFVFMLSAYEKDFKQQLETPVMKLVMISIAALLISIALGYFLFRKWIKKMDILSSTARKICLGELNLRSHICGKDDIGILGVAFDSMLDSLEDNLKNLDLKVQERTLALEESLKIKEVLLKEIHHRVKNNLSLTINFIKLLRYKIENKEIQTLLSDMENRIYTMSLLHTKLYESENLDSIDMEKYIKELSLDIAQSYGISKQIDLSLHIEKIFFTMDDALPCGLIVNECLTNAFKHAFEGDEGAVAVELKRTPNGIVLRIADNGRGLPYSLDEMTHLKTLGVQLIHTIATKQLSGTIECVNTDGVTWIIHFTPHD